MPRPMTSRDSPRIAVPLDSRRAAVWSALAVALVSGLFSAFRVGRPIPWRDEAATLMTAGRPPAEIFTVVRHVDAVHAVYYLLMHYWQLVFGATVTADRYVSVVSVGVTAGLLVLLGREVRDLPTGVMAGLAFTVIPRVMWTSTEARSYALMTALVVATLLVFLAAARRDTWGWWVGYTLLVVLTAYVFLFAVLCFVVLPFVVAALPMTRRARLRWAGGTVVAGAAAIPLVLVGRAQSSQVSWIQAPDLKAPFTYQFFAANWMPLSLITNALAWVLLLGGLATLAVETRRAGRVRPPSGDGTMATGGTGSGGGWDRDALGQAVLVTGWLVLPTLLLVLGSYVTAPMYVARYLAMSDPAVALLIATAISAAAGLVAHGTTRVRSRGTRPATADATGHPAADPTFRLRSRRGAALAVAVVLLLAWGGATSRAWRSYHWVGAKSASWADFGHYIAEHKQPGDGLAVDDPMTLGLVHTQPTAMAGLRQINTIREYRETDQLWDTIVPVSAATTELAGTDRVWYVGFRIPDEDRAALEAAGFHEVLHRTASDGILVLFQRS
ncbi:glycosyltransferase family 39 protein [Raineyella fluvialis]|uniref:Uncharacterized protein n=1 Tax=Raineyella fluvialis TaxID=2662261 RepID=A0A5Q2F9F9_9ACTN|nr:glycosyltransferase family 39 protein [Raineyella fluvialis]QGF23610.1 hypothetical protein Rai3103_07950 [Raineyella fluvialis]